MYYPSLTIDQYYVSDLQIQKLFERISLSLYRSFSLSKALRRPLGSLPCRCFRLEAIFFRFILQNFQLLYLEVGTPFLVE